MSNNSTPPYQTQSQSDYLNRKLTASFRARELMCHCCYAEGIKDELVYRLQRAHDLLPPSAVMIITSGYRCKKHNQSVGGIEDSAHMKGLAADIKCEDPSYRFLLISALLEVGFPRIGRYENFLHVDLDKTKPQKVMW